MRVNHPKGEPNDNHEGQGMFTALVVTRQASFVDRHYRQPARDILENIWGLLEVVVVVHTSSKVWVGGEGGGVLFHDARLSWSSGECLANQSRYAAKWV